MSIFDIFKQIEKELTPQGPVEFIIVGLGNPGTKYENTRHNMGFMAIDTLAEKVGADIKKLRFKSLTAEAMVGGKKVLLMKPTTFMNNSGEAIVDALNFYKLSTEKLLVLYDDISLDVGKMRIRTKGSAGGHNGIKSIIYLTGSDVFPRIKMGVGQKPNKDYDLADWVLGHFPKEQGEALEQVFANAAAAAELIVSGKTTDAMNKYN